MTITPAHSNDNTSLSAATAIAPHASDQRERIYAYIDSCGLAGATISQVADALGMRTASVCGRMSELRGIVYGDSGKTMLLPVRVYDSGLRRCYGDSTATGKVWLAVKA